MGNPDKNRNVTIRRIEANDVHNISRLINRCGGIPLIKQAFPKYSHNALIERAYITLLLEETFIDDLAIDSTFDESKNTSEPTLRVNCKGCISVTDGISFGGKTNAFEQVIYDLTEFLPSAQTSNTLFLNFWTVEENSVNIESLTHKLLKEFFAICPEIDYIVFMSPSANMTTDLMDKFLTQIHRPDYDEDEYVNHIFDEHNIYYMHRAKFLPKLLVREARAEDNDELIPIVEHVSPEVLEGQSRYYFSELIERQNEKTKYFVGLDTSDSVVALLGTTLEIDVQHLRKVYDLDGVENMVITNQEEITINPLFISIVGDLRSVDIENLFKSGINSIIVVDFESATRTLAAASEEKSESKDKTEESNDKDISHIVDEKSDTKKDEDSKAQDKVQSHKKQAMASAKDDASFKNEDESAKDFSDLESEAKAPEAKQNHEAKSNDSKIVEERPQVNYTQSPILNNLIADEMVKSSIKSPKCIIFFGLPEVPKESSDHDIEVKISDETLEIIDGLYKTSNHIIEVVVEGEISDDEDEYLFRKFNAVDRLRDLLPDEEDMSTLDGHDREIPEWHYLPVPSNEESVDNTELLMTETFKKIDKYLSDIDIKIDGESEKRVNCTLNAFEISLMSMKDDYASRVEDLLRLAFEENDNIDYCLYVVPNNAPPSSQLRYFTRVSANRGISNTHNLFMIHKSIFLAKSHLELRRYEAHHSDSVKTFLAPLHDNDRDKIMKFSEDTLIERDIDLSHNPKQISLIVSIAGIIVGYVQVSNKIVSRDDVDWIYANYKIDDVVNFDKHSPKDQGVILSWNLNPIYSKYTRYIVREIMRVYNKTLLYFHGEIDESPPKDIIDDFYHVCPRRRMQDCNEPNHDKVKLRQRPSDGASSAASPMFAISKRNLSSPKSTVYKRIVVAAGNCHSFAFLESLYFVPNLNFPNIYIITPNPNNIMGEIAPMISSFVDKSEDPKEDSKEDSKEDKLDNKDKGGFEDSETIDFSGCLTKKSVEFPTVEELSAMGFRHKAHILQGDVTGIDRASQAVVVDNEIMLEYDVFLLSTMTQDNTPSLFPSIGDKHPNSWMSMGIFSLGNNVVDSLALNWIQNRKSTQDSIVIYGNPIDAFAALASLMKKIPNLDPSKLIVVLKCAITNLDGIEDKAVSDRLADVIHRTGVKVYAKHHVTDVSIGRNKFLDRVHIVKSQDNEANKNDDTLRTTIQCKTMLCCFTSDATRNIFHAVNDCGLVFDGQMVVNNSFRTVDENIYALGEFTKYSRVYAMHAGNQSMADRVNIPHSLYNPREVGYFVAAKVLEQHLDPESPLCSLYNGNIDDLNASFSNIMSATGNVNTNKFSFNNTSSKLGSRSLSFVDERSVTVFNLPRSYTCLMPSNLQFFSSKLPKLFNQSENITTFPTKPSGKKQNCSTLKTCDYGLVCEFLYLGEDKIEERNLQKVVGKYESYLNCAAHTYERGMIEDWVTFFRGPWATTLYHDNFPVLEQKLYQSLQSDVGTTIFVEKIMKGEQEDTSDLVNFDDHEEVFNYKRKILGPHCEKIEDATYRTISKSVSKFIKENESEFTMYHHSSKK